MEMVSPALGDWPPPDSPEHPAFVDLGARALERDQEHPWVEIARWFERKPPFAHWFRRGQQITLTANQLRASITGYRIPAGCLGVLRFFANQTGNASDSPSVTFALLIDGQALPGFASLIGSVSPSMQSPTPLMDPLNGQQVVQVVASNTSASSISNVAGAIIGWYWAAALGAGWPRR